MVEYKLEVDSIHPHMYYIYKHTDNEISIVAVIYRNFELAKWFYNQLQFSRVNLVEENNKE